jgi:hypothetical protein
VLTSSGSCLLQGGGLGLLLLKEEVGGLDAATGNGGLRLGVLDDGLEPSTEGSSLGVIQHGKLATTRGREPAVADEQCHG